MDWILLAQDTAVDAGDEPSGLDALFESMMTPRGHFLLCAVLLIVGIFWLLPPRGRGKGFLVGAFLTAMSVLLILLPTLAKLPAAPAFFLLEGLAVLGGLGTVTSRSPVYSAIWFASALLAIGAILLMGGAQFLGLATVAVYAGAIVVTFLFVLMLAQPEGHAVYDRLGWGWLPSLCATIAGVSFAAVVSIGLLGTPQTTDEDSSRQVAKVAGVNVPAANIPAANIPAANVAAATVEATSTKDILASDHVARLGGELYGRHLISVQVAAVLLLVALVGAIAMAIHGKDLSPNSVGEAGR